MRMLQTITAIIEAGAGLALLCWPSAVVGLLLGSRLEAPAAAAVGRVAGAALLTLGIACWLVRPEARSRAAIGLITAMVLYNFATAALLTFDDAELGLRGAALWPAVVLHAAMAIWCITSLRKETGAARHEKESGGELT